MKSFFSQFQLQKHGLERVLGELETAIMKQIWSSGPATVRHVHQHLEAERELAYTTVMTVMSRLADKGLLIKEKTGNAFTYAAAMSEQEFHKTTGAKIIDALLDTFGTPVISQFVDRVGREHPDQMDELERLVREKRSGDGD